MLVIELPLIVTLSCPPEPTTLTVLLPGPAEMLWMMLECVGKISIKSSPWPELNATELTSRLGTSSVIPST